MDADFLYDVFLSFSSKDREVVRVVAKRLAADGLRVWFDEWENPAGVDVDLSIRAALETSRVLVLCMSANALGSDWARLERETVPFLDPLNREQRLVPLLLDGAPVMAMLSNFQSIKWSGGDTDKAYAELLVACLPPGSPPAPASEPVSVRRAEASILLEPAPFILNYAFSADCRHILSGSGDKDHAVRLWERVTGRCLKVLAGHHAQVLRVAFSPRPGFALSASSDCTLRVWNLETGECTNVLSGNIGPIEGFALSADGLRAVSVSDDGTLAFWDLATGKCLQTVVPAVSEAIGCVSWNSDESKVLAGFRDGTVRLWDVASSRWLHTFEGHTGMVRRVVWTRDSKRCISASVDGSVRVWNVASGRSLQILTAPVRASTADAKLFVVDRGLDVRDITLSADERYLACGCNDSSVLVGDLLESAWVTIFKGHKSPVCSVSWSDDGTHIYSGDSRGGIRTWNAAARKTARPVAKPKRQKQDVPSEVLYTNAKVLVVGDSGAGKTALTHQLASGAWKPSEDSTVGVWSTQWALKCTDTASGEEREIWLWDFGGQADQRLIHQLYMDNTAVILLLFNADNENVLTGLRDWQSALGRAATGKIATMLVAGRVDTGFRISRASVQTFAKEQGFDYIETSAKTGEGCEELRQKVISAVPWQQMMKRTSPLIFKIIRDEILKLRDEGRVLHTFKELRELLWQRLPSEPRFSDQTLETVIDLLDGPGAVTELDYGTYVLLAPEWINTYAQAVIRTLRSAENQLGALALRSIAEGRLIYQSIGRDGVPVEMQRLPAAEERVILGEMERQLEQRGLCLRQGDKLVFPSHCGRDRPLAKAHPPALVSYSIRGFLDDIYATLVVRLADSQAFTLKDLWRDGADFATLSDEHRVGVTLTRNTDSSGCIDVYFDPGVKEGEQVIFANYIHSHLKSKCENAQRLRHYVCPNCHTPKGNSAVLMQKLLAGKKNADTECDGCGKRFLLWDALERKFASEEMQRRVQELQASDLAALTARRKGKLLVLDVSSRITSANQKCIEVPQDEDDGIDMILEFTDAAGNGLGKGLCLQLKAGNSHLSRRKSDGVEIFAIKKQRWVRTWTHQPYPVMLVIGTFSEEDEQADRRQRIEFADVRWMEISSVLKQLSGGGKRQVKQVEFRGERLDMSSVRRWRDIMLSGQPQ